MFTVCRLWFLLVANKGWAAWHISFWRKTTNRCASSWRRPWCKAGHAVTDFGDGGDAYECLKGFTFDLLLTDIVMPGMDGIELAKRAAEINGALKIMFITGFAAVALHPASEAPKQAKVLSKPFHLREIVAEVDRMLAAA